MHKRAVMAAVGLVALLGVPSAFGAENVPLDWATFTVDRKVLLVSPTVVRVTGTLTCSIPPDAVEQNGDGIMAAGVVIHVQVTQGKGNSAVPTSGTAFLQADPLTGDPGDCFDAVNRTWTWALDIPATYPTDPAGPTWRTGPADIATYLWGWAEGWALQPGDYYSSSGYSPTLYTSGRVSKK
jgi:hypothetical protein